MEVFSEKFSQYCCHTSVESPYVIKCFGITRWIIPLIRYGIAYPRGFALVLIILKRHVVAIRYVLWPLLHNSLSASQCTLASIYTCLDAWRHVSDLQIYLQTVG
jgi:hypothetical protein